MNHIKRYVFDIDGTICTDTGGDYASAAPLIERISLINALFNNGNIITLLTARGMGSSENDVDLAKQKWEAFTISQLRMWGVSYHYLFFGKPAGDVYVDDKAISDFDFFDS